LVQALQLVGDKDALPDLRDLEAKLTEPGQKRQVHDVIAALSESVASA
jgi:hypothetical protein